MCVLIFHLYITYWEGYFSSTWLHMDYILELHTKCLLTEIFLLLFLVRRSLLTFEHKKD